MMYVTENELNVRDSNKDKGNEQEGVGYTALVIEDDGSGVPWEGGINGTFYRISRGVPVKIPENLARLIRANARVSELSETELYEYKTSSGKRLG